MKKHLTKLVLILGLVLVFAACNGGTPSGDTTPGDTPDNGPEPVTIRIGASPVPHAEILELIRDDLAAEGVLLDIVEFTEFGLVNPALAQGDLDANFFQHEPFLLNYVADSGNQLVYTVRVHIEPIGLYSHSLASVSEIPEGGTIAIPNDATNGGRALLLLESLGLITLADGAGLLATTIDITDNPLGLEIIELDAALLPRTLGDTDASVINTNIALQSGLNPTTDTIARESADSPYANILAVRPENANDEAIQILSSWLNSDKVREFILETFGGNILPVF